MNIEFNVNNNITNHVEFSPQVDMLHKRYDIYTENDDKKNKDVEHIEEDDKIYRKLNTKNTTLIEKTPDGSPGNNPSSLKPDTRSPPNPVHLFEDDIFQYDYNIVEYQTPDYESKVPTEIQRNKNRPNQLPKNDSTTAPTSMKVYRNFDNSTFQKPETIKQPLHKSEYYQAENLATQDYDNIKIMNDLSCQSNSKQSSHQPSHMKNSYSANPQNAYMNVNNAPPKIFDDLNYSMSNHSNNRFNDYENEQMINTQKATKMSQKENNLDPVYKQKVNYEAKFKTNNTKDKLEFDSFDNELNRGKNSDMMAIKMEIQNIYDEQDRVEGKSKPRQYNINEDPTYLPFQNKKKQINEYNVVQKLNEWDRINEKLLTLNENIITVLHMKCEHCVKSHNNKSPAMAKGWNDCFVCCKQWPWISKDGFPGAQDKFELLNDRLKLIFEMIFYDQHPVNDDLTNEKRMCDDLKKDINVMKKKLTLEESRKSEQIDDLKSQIHRLKSFQIEHVTTIDSLTKELEPARLRMRDLEELQKVTALKLKHTQENEVGLFKTINILETKVISQTNKLQNLEQYKNIDGEKRKIDLDFISELELLLSQSKQQKKQDDIKIVGLKNEFDLKNNDLETKTKQLKTLNQHVKDLNDRIEKLKADSDKEKSRLLDEIKNLKCHTQDSISNGQEWKKMFVEREGQLRGLSSKIAELGDFSDLVKFASPIKSTYNVSPNKNSILSSWGHTQNEQPSNNSDRRNITDEKKYAFDYGVGTTNDDLNFFKINEEKEFSLMNKDSRDFNFDEKNKFNLDTDLLDETVKFEVRKDLGNKNRIYK